MPNAQYSDAYILSIPNLFVNQSVCVMSGKAIFRKKKKSVKNSDDVTYLLKSFRVCTIFSLKNKALFTEPFEAKGQLISKCLFGATASTKKPTKFLP